MSLTRRLIGAVLVSGAVAGGGLTLATPASAAGAAKCSDVEVVAARGTAEPGKFGSVVGDSVVAQLQKKLAGKKSVSGYAVDYPATVDWNSANLGRADLVAHVLAQAKACPKQAFVLSGYSQGANVVDTSIGITMDGYNLAGSQATIPDSLASRVKAVLLFGNPFRLTGMPTAGPYLSRTLDVCRAGDPACDPGGKDVLTHTYYKENTDAATTFAVKKLLGGSSGGGVSLPLPSAPASSAPPVTGPSPAAPVDPAVAAAKAAAEAAQVLNAAKFVLSTIQGWGIGFIQWPAAGK